MEKQINIINTAQDFINGIQHYAVDIDGQLMILTSERKLIPLWVMQSAGSKFTTDALAISRFSPHVINEYINGAMVINVQRVFEDIKRYIKKYIILSDPVHYSILPLWVIGTYGFRIFRNYPYLHLYAEKGSGKTTLLEILERICFNGDLSADASSAALFHEVHNNSSTLLLDESEDLFQGRESNKSRLLKAGFSKSGKIKRMGHTYYCYSPKIIASIRELNDVLADRAITIRMVRKLSSENVENYIETRENLELQSGIRDSLYVFGLTYAGKINAEYMKLSEHVQDYGLNNRARDLWAPLIIIAGLINDSIEDEVLQYAREYSLERQENDLEENETARLLAVLSGVIVDIQPVRLDGDTKYYNADLLYAYFKATAQIPHTASRTWLSRMLHKKFNIACVPVRGESEVQRAFVIDIIKLNELVKRYLP